MICQYSVPRFMSVKFTILIHISLQKWTSFGFHPTDETEDVASMHIYSFIGVTICIVLGTLAYYYGPDKS